MARALRRDFVASQALGTMEEEGKAPSNKADDVVDDVGCDACAGSKDGMCECCAKEFDAIWKQAEDKGNKETKAKAPKALSKDGGADTQTSSGGGGCKNVGNNDDRFYITMRPETLEHWDANKYEIKGFELSSKGVYKMAVTRKLEEQETKKTSKDKVESNKDDEEPLKKARVSQSANTRHVLP